MCECVVVSSRHNNTESVTSPLCNLCLDTHYEHVSDRVEDYDHVFFICPVYQHARQLLQPSINHIRHKLRAHHIAEINITPSAPNMDDSDVEQIWVAATVQPPRVAVVGDNNDNGQRVVIMPSVTPPIPWHWWLRSSIIIRLLSLRRYHNAVKRYLHSVMLLRQQHV